jgi:hypothetical protein
MISQIELCRKPNKKAIEKLKETSVIVDVSTSSQDPIWSKLAPNYPHGNIPIPGMPGVMSLTVDGVYEGLKTFKDGSGIDASKFRAKSTGKIMRTKRTHGEIAAFKYGDQAIYDEVAARRHIYVPTYRWMLDNIVRSELLMLAEQAMLGKKIVLVDMSISHDIEDLDKRFSHAVMIRAWVVEFIAVHGQKFMEQRNSELAAGNGGSGSGVAAMPAAVPPPSAHIATLAEILPPSSAREGAVATQSSALGFFQPADESTVDM